MSSADLQRQRSRVINMHLRRDDDEQKQKRERACALRRHCASRQDTPWTECQPIAGHTHTHTHSLTQSHTTDNLQIPINLPCMSLDRGRTPEYPEETPEARGEHANSTHAVEAGIANPGVIFCSQVMSFYPALVIIAQYKKVFNLLFKPSPLKTTFSFRLHTTIM
ncbi:hypothetical protein QTP86_018967 [Hemibagrus guttatus]|nr:hypothetical protein QTP86_018967 [Hemibagrus guttatus]